MAVINKYALEGRDDYIGFTYNGHHSSEYRIVRVSSGSRYETSLVPTPKDTTIDAVGRDGLYYVTSKYQQLTIPVNIAFDDLYDEDIRKMKEWLSPKTEGELWFDEDPYKQYSAKITSNPKLSWIAFDDPEKEKGRVYKGEGTIQFICYYPWATSRFRNLSEVYRDVYGVEDPSASTKVINTFVERNADSISLSLSTTNFITTTPLTCLDTQKSHLVTDQEIQVEGNLTVITITPATIFDNEELQIGNGYFNFSYKEKNLSVSLPRGWETASGLEAKRVLETTGTGKTFDHIKQGASEALVYNAGNIATPCQLSFSLAAKKGIQKIEYFKGTGTSSSSSLGRLYVDTSQLYDATNAKEEAFLLDSKLHLLLGIKMPNSPGTYIQTGNVYNYAIVGGDFFDIEPGEGTIKLNPSNGTYVIFQPAVAGNIVYDYLYY